MIFPSGTGSVFKPRRARASRGRFEDSAALVMGLGRPSDDMMREFERVLREGYALQWCNGRILDILTGVK